MGFFDFLFSSSPSGTTGGSTTYNYPSAPPEVQEGIKSLVTRGQTESQRPYSPFPGGRIEPFAPRETEAFDYLGDTYNQYAPRFEQGLGYLEEGAAPITDVSQYMDPYIGDVVSTTMEEMNRQGLMGLNALRGQAVNAGGLTNNRLGVAEAEYLKNQDLNKA